MMKRSLVLIFAVIIGACMIGCSKSDEGDNTVVTPGTAKSTPAPGGAAGNVKGVSPAKPTNN